MRKRGFVTCAQCRYWEADATEHGVGECHLRAPTAQAPHPIVQAEDGCGEGKLHNEIYERTPRYERTEQG